MLVDELGFNEDFERKPHISGVPLGEIFEPVKVKIKDLIIKSNSFEIPMLPCGIDLFNH